MRMFEKGSNGSLWGEHILMFGQEGDRRDPQADGDSDFLRAFGLHMWNMQRKPTLDVDIVSHCNLNCTCCCHFSPIATPGYLSLDAYAKELDLLAKIKGVEDFFDSICLMGGEPLLHPDAAAFVRLTREVLPKMGIRIVSNGLLVRTLSGELWDVMRAAGAELLMTPYPVDIDYSELVDYVREKGVTAKVGGGLAVAKDGCSFFLKTPLDERGNCDPVQAFVVCPLAGSTMQLLDGRIYPCNRGALFDTLNQRFGTSFAHEKGDYLDLAELSNVEKIDSFRRRHKPMCRYCAYEKTERVIWKESSLQADEWLVESD